MKQILITTILMLLSLQVMLGQTVKTKSNIKYQLNLNGTLDKSLVQRLIVFSQNRISYITRTNKMEAMLNYKFGHVTPNGKPRLNLENDITAIADNQFLHYKKVFPAAMAGFETSPYLRKLNTRWFMGGGVGTYLAKLQNHQVQLNIYGMYEQSAFNSFNYNGTRIMPFIKGRHSFDKDKFGIMYVASYATAVNEGNNYRFRTMLKPYFKINKKVDFNLLYDLGYESKTEMNQPAEISILTIGFSYSNF